MIRRTRWRWLLLALGLPASLGLGWHGKAPAAEMHGALCKAVVEAVMPLAETPDALTLSEVLDILKRTDSQYAAHETFYMAAVVFVAEHQHIEKSRLRLTIWQQCVEEHKK